MVDNSLAGAALPLLLDAAIKGTVVLLVGCVLAGMVRRASAASRHLVWGLTCVGLLVVPIAVIAAPLWHLPLAAMEFAGWHSTSDAILANGSVLFVFDEQDKSPTNAVVQSAGPHVNPVLMASRGNSLPGALAITDPQVQAVVAPAPSIMARLLVLTWLSGVLLSVIWLLCGWLSLLRLTRHCRRVHEGRLFNMVALVAQRLGIRRPVHVLMSSQRAIPMTWGLAHPVVLLPEEAENWSNDRLCMVLIHELGHVVRWDCLVQMLGHLARGIFWFHPLAWLANRQLRIEQEHACDDLVLSTGSSAPDYAEHLLAVTAGLSRGFWTAPVALGMSRTEKLRTRIVRLLDSGRDHRPIRRRTLVLCSAVALAVAVPLGTAGFSPTNAAGQTEQGPEQTKQPPTGKDDALVKKITEIQQKLAKNYITTVDEKVLADAALKGLLAGLKDPNTAYLSADDLARFNTETKGSITGIGVQLQMADGQIRVVTPLEGSPAVQAGLRPGDQIDSIDGKSTKGMTMAEAVKLILGTAGSTVKLGVVRDDGKAEELSATRAEVRIRSVNGFQRGPDGKWQMLLDPEGKVGYLRIEQFASNTTAEVRESIVALQKAGMKGLIVDLRFCPGGLLDQALEVSKLFLAKGTILTTRGKDKEEKTWKADGKETLGDFPLVVLLNEQTASAGEIVAGALQDNQRAVLLGTRSFGKGSVTMIVKLDEGGAIKLTTANHFLPSGRSIQKLPGEKKWGVDPDDGFYVPLTPAQTDALAKDARERSILNPKKDAKPQASAGLTPKIIEERHADPQLAAALTTMLGRLSTGSFPKVGKDNSVLMDQAFRVEELRQRRKQLVQQLSEIDSGQGFAVLEQKTREQLLQDMLQIERDITAIQQSVSKK